MNDEITAKGNIVAVWMIRRDEHRCEYKDNDPTASPFGIEALAFFQHSVAGSLDAYV